MFFCSFFWAFKPSSKRHRAVPDWSSSWFVYVATQCAIGLCNMCIQECIFCIRWVLIGWVPIRIEFPFEFHCFIPNEKTMQNDAHSDAIACHSHFWGVQSSLALAWSRTWTEPWLELRCTQCWSMLDLYYVHQVPSKSMRPWFCATLAKESTETMVLRLQWELTRQQEQLVWNFGILCLVLLYRV